MADWHYRIYQQRNGMWVATAVKGEGEDAIKLGVQRGDRQSAVAQLHMEVAAYERTHADSN